MYEGSEEELENRRRYEEEMEHQARTVYDWARYYQEESDRAEAHWDDFEDKIEDRLNVR